MELSAAEIRRAVQAALAEDIGSGDATTLATVPETATARAVMQAREPLVVAGLDFAEAAFREVSRRCQNRNDWPKTASRSRPATFC